MFIFKNYFRNYCYSIIDNLNLNDQESLRQSLNKSFFHKAKYPEPEKNKKVYMRILVSFVIFFIFFFPIEISFADDFVILKNNKVNVRYGPSFEFPIKFIYKKLVSSIIHMSQKVL